MTSTWQNLVARRDLVVELTRSELRSGSAESSLGWLWWLVDPLLMMAIYWVVLVVILGRGAEPYAPYPIFVLCALTSWKWFTSSTSRCSRLLRSKESLIKSVPFPTLALPLSVVTSGFFYFLAGFAVLATAAALWPSARHSGALAPLIQLPFLMLFQLAVVLGVALAVSCLGVLVRDLAGLLSHALRIGFYLTPGLYGVDLVQRQLESHFGAALGAKLFTLYMLNPFAVLVTGYRDALLYGRWIDAKFWALLALSSLTILALGWTLYQHYDRRVIKFL